ncbi:MAG: hypothetical protein M3Y53_12680 [Thermoproteota archaeon]|nr:hypothetical protein [Thermoproteota archaeon]
MLRHYSIVAVRYDSIYNLIEHIDSRIEDLQDQNASNNDNNLKQGLKAQIKSLDEKKVVRLEIRLS